MNDLKNYPHISEADLPKILSQVNELRSSSDLKSFFNECMTASRHIFASEEANEDKEILEGFFLSLQIVGGLY